MSETDDPRLTSTCQLCRSEEKPKVWNSPSSSLFLDNILLERRSDDVLPHPVSFPLPSSATVQNSNGLLISHQVGHGVSKTRSDRAFTLDLSRKILFLFVSDWLPVCVSSVMDCQPLEEKISSKWYPLKTLYVHRQTESVLQIKIFRRIRITVRLRLSWFCVPYQCSSEYAARQDAFVISPLAYLIVYHREGGVVRGDDGMSTDYWVAGRLIMGVVTRVSIHCG